ncbi:tetraspanin [Wolfiporia cocos MD-104 SS10]|uniref:Tetraspanin n=1 Tax=Wolfiporia cocos (strain MD-104) TaxID=742152 RepID=A0A2H3JPW6_WOLCO|nr:tetraspanin [Wolfiporia cocos MD-104 SS10]
MSKQTKMIMGFWGFVNVCLLAAAIISIVFSVVWREPNLLLNLTLSTTHLNAGLIMGIILLISWLISIGALLSSNNSVMGFVVLNWALVVDSIAVLIVGTIFWQYTLGIRNNYLQVWEAQSTETRIAVQDLFKCCGYYAPNDTTVALGGFCANQTFVDGLFVSNTSNTNACVGPITAFAEPTLNQIFTYVYGFMAVVICLFLASLCVIKTRQEKERFRKIDAKRGGRGFV